MLTSLCFIMAFALFLMEKPGAGWLVFGGILIAPLGI